MLVVSAFPNDYAPTSSSLIGALAQKGLSVGSLATHKDVDLREAFSCWLSREFIPRDPRLQFRRILCFEPLRRGAPPEVAGDIFRALTPILAEKPEIRTIAMPIVAAGDQGYAVAEMLSPLLDAALHWLENGLPLDCVKVVAYSDTHAQDAQEVFSRQKSDYVSAVQEARTQADYDVFMSYSSGNASESGGPAASSSQVPAGHQNILISPRDRHWMCMATRSL